MKFYRNLLATLAISVPIVTNAAAANYPITASAPARIKAQQPLIKNNPIGVINLSHEVNNNNEGRLIKLRVINNSTEIWHSFKAGITQPSPYSVVNIVCDAKTPKKMVPGSGCDVTIRYQSSINTVANQENELEIVGEYTDANAQSQQYTYRYNLKGIPAF